MLHKAFKRYHIALMNPTDSSKYSQLPPSLCRAFSVSWSFSWVETH